MSQLFDLCFSIENLEKAYKKSLESGSKFKQESLKFQRNETANLLILQQSLYNRTYKFMGYSNFKVYEPKERIINAPRYRDKIVQLALDRIIRKILMKKFIKNSYACMEDRGTHKAVEQVQKNLKQAYWEWGEDAYICKIDVKKFFYSIDRDILKGQYRKVIKEEDVLWVIDEIIDSANEIDDVGMPLGNTLSQLSANVTLNDLDQYCQRYLCYKYYVRYADDTVIVLKNKEEANRAKLLSCKFLNKRLNLKENEDKTQIYPIDQGVNAFGFKIYRTHRLLRNDSKKRIKGKIKKMPRLINESRMTIDKANQMLGSWSGHAKYANSYNFIQSLLKRFPYLKLVETKKKNKILKINEEELKCYIEKMKNTN